MVPETPTGKPVKPAMPTPGEELKQGLQQLGFHVEDAAIEGQLADLLSYLELLQKWNSTFNLVGETDSDSMVSRHLLDSLAVSPYLDGNTILDVGTGAGLPGIPLAILNPQKQFILMDSNGKKTRFLFQVKVALGLVNVTVENCRVEHYQSNQQIDMVVCRAFSSLTDMVKKCEPLITRGGKLLAMKGRYPEQEIQELPPGFSVTEVVKLDIPNSGSERHLVEISAS